MRDVDRQQDKTPSRAPTGAKAAGDKEGSGDSGAPNLQLKGKDHILRAHAKGTKQSDGYQLDMGKPVTLVYRRQLKAVPVPGSGDAKVFACTSGAPTCRPIRLKRNTKGIWKVYSFSSIVVDIKKPPVTDDGDDL